MCEESEITYLDGDVVWVKLGSCWWPGEVVGPDKLPPDLLASFKKPPIAVVKFYQEDTYEYVKNQNSIFKYNCSRKDEFIKKGMYMYRSKKGNMEKFPDDVVRAEVAVDGDKDILTREEFQEEKKESYAGLFGDPKKNYDSAKKGKTSKGKVFETTPIHRLRHKSDYKVHILVQNTKSPRQSTETAPSPSTSRAGSEPLDSSPQKEPQTQNNEKPVNSTPIASTPGTYACHSCNFITTRLNVLIMHNKSHSSTFSAYTPSPMSFKRKPVVKSPKASPDPTATPKSRKPKQQKVEKATKKQAKKRVAEPAPADAEVKKSKTDVEIKSSLLADWDDGEEESNDESSTVMAGSPEIPVASESPAIPTEAELPSAQVPEEEVPPKAETNDDEQSTAPEKPEPSNDAKYDFCEDEDWPVETDVGRKIPRVKNPSKRKDESKSLSIDDDEMAKEVAELLSKSTLPELPAIPETFKEEENFPEPSIVKSPDKQIDKVQPPTNETKGPSETTPTKTIFKTKTFFRSRHSRSQDAIGKYVAEQLNAAERLDMSENDLNGADITSLIGPRISLPVEHVKVARLAPKIQLKKMKAEAAQLLERERYNNSHMFKEQSVLDSSNVLETVEKSSQAVEEPAKTINEENILCENKNTVNENVQLGTTEIVEEHRKVCEIELESVDSKVEDITEKDIVKADNIDDKNGKEVVNADIIDDKSEKEVVNADNIDDKSEKEVVNADNIDDKSEKEVVNADNIDDKSEKEHEKVTGVPENIRIKDTNNTTLETLTEPMEVFKPYMSESTASAVDALLSVSRETDRVTKVISDDPPEDLFEDDNKDSKPFCVSNGINENHHENDIPESMDICPGVHLEENIANDNIINEEDNSKVKNLSTADEEITKDTSVPPLEDPSFNMDKTDIVLENNDAIAAKKDTELENNDTVIADKDNGAIENNLSSENVPSESDLQVAQALINLPSTNSVRSKLVTESKIISPKKKPESYTLLNTILDQGFKNAKDHQTILTNTVSAVVLPDGEISPNTETLSSRFETEQEKSENLNAAQSLVQMSESIDHKMNVKEINIMKDEIIKPISTSVEAQVKTSQKVEHVTSTTSEITSQPVVNKSLLSVTNSPKLLKMLEEPALQKIAPAKHVIVSGNDKILNFDIGKSLKNKTTKQKIIIRRAAPSKTLLNNVTESPTSHKIILAPSNKSQEGNSVTYSIQPAPISPDSNAIVYQPKIRKISKPVSKLQKIKPQVLPKIEPKILSSPMKDKVDADKMNTDAMFDINSMPVVLSDDILTPESIEKMPIVMTDGNIITPTSNPTKVIKKQVTSVNEKVHLTSTPKTETKTLLVNSVTDTKVTSTPNILSKSSKIRGTKPLLVIDKTGKQKLVMLKSESQVKEVKSTTLLQPAPQPPAKTEKFIILPTTSAQRPVVRTQKIVIDPQTRKAHVFVGKAPEAAPNVDNKPVSAKLISSAAETNSTGNTVMIITNAQGAQSRIVLTSEHEKILFPNKQQPNVTQLKKIVQRISPNNGAAPKQPVVAAPPPKTAQPRIVQKQKSTVITSKGQLIVGGRAPAPTPNIAPAPAPLPEIRPAAPKRIIAAEPKKLVQTIQKNSSEPLIFLQQKNGSVMQLTVAQFEHLQRTGQIVQKAPPPPPQEKIVVQKSITIKPPDKPASPVPKPRARRQVAETAPAAKRPKHEPPLAPGRPVVTQMPSLAPLTGTMAPAAAVSASGSSFGELENFEELLPSTTIARQPEPAPAPPELAPAPLEPAPAPLAAAPAPAHVDGQLLAIPGENFGGPPGTFYLCVEDSGTLTPIDNRPLVLEDNQLVPMADAAIAAVVAVPQPERRDILEAALANSDVFHAEPCDEAPDFRDLNANVSVHCRVSETSTTLNQPIMTPVEVPSKIGGSPAATSSLEAGLAVIGVTPPTVPTSLELPITVTDPRIAPRTTDPLGNGGYGALLASPNTGMTFVTTDEVQVSAAPISMPLLTDDDELGKSMPILTDAPLPAADLAHTS